MMSSELSDGLSDLLEVLGKVFFNQCSLSFSVQSLAVCPISVIGIKAEKCFDIDMKIYKDSPLPNGFNPDCYGT